MHYETLNTQPVDLHCQFHKMNYLFLAGFSCSVLCFFLYSQIYSLVVSSPGVPSH